jgi:hypothetical protein
MVKYGGEREPRTMRGGRKPRFFPDLRCTLSQDTARESRAVNPVRVFLLFGTLNRAGGDKELRLKNKLLLTRRVQIYTGG